MAVGDLSASTPVYSETEADIDTAITALNLAATTDFIIVIPWKNGALTFKVERASA